jgi:hypothetical protein
VRHRDLILANAMSGHRPDEWWIYEKGRDPPDHENETALLFSMGELTEAETESAMQGWRYFYEMTLDPDFFVCLGPGEFIEGAKARSFQYRYYRIPPELVRKWDAERKRQATTIRKLAQTTNGG